MKLSVSSSRLVSRTTCPIQTGGRGSFWLNLRCSFLLGVRDVGLVIRLSREPAWQTSPNPTDKSVGYCHSSASPTLAARRHPKSTPEACVPVRTVIQKTLRPHDKLLHPVVSMTRRLQSKAR